MGTFYFLFPSYSALSFIYSMSSMPRISMRWSKTTMLSSKQNCLRLLWAANNGTKSVKQRWDLGVLMRWSCLGWATRRRRRKRTETTRSLGEYSRSRMTNDSMKWTIDGWGVPNGVFSSRSDCRYSLTYSLTDWLLALTWLIPFEDLTDVTLARWWRWWRRLDWCNPGEWWYLLKTWLMLL